MKLALILITGFAACFISACDRAETESEVHMQSKYGWHGGEIIPIGDVGHVEVCHSPTYGMVKLYLTGPDRTTELAVEKVPVLRLLKVPGEPVFTPKPDDLFEGKASEFTITDDKFKIAHLDVRITVTVGNQEFTCDLARKHGH